MTHWKHFATALAISLVSAGILASGAFATASTELGQWYVAGSKLSVGSSANANCALKSGTVATIIGEIGTEPFELKATGVNCVGWKIKETQVGGLNMAVGEGQLEFTGVSVVKPTCQFEVGNLPATTLKTTELTEQVQMEGLTTYVKLAPVSGSEVAKWELAPGNPSCMGTDKLTGITFGKTAPTGTSTVFQQATFSKATDETAGGSLGIAGNAAFLSAEIVFSLASGSEWTANQT